MQLENQKEKAAKAFHEAAALWENPLISRPPARNTPKGWLGAASD